MKHATIFISILLLTQFIAISQNPDSLKNYLPPENYIRINYDNDLFSGTDRYYTQGIKLELIHTSLRKSPLSKLLFPINKTSKNYYGVALQQDAFTPKSIRHDSIFFGERPYAAVFFLSNYLISMDNIKHQRLTTQFDIGVIGPYAKGAEEQKDIHRWTKNLQPFGWQYQIANDIILNYNTQFEKGFLNAKYFELIGQTEIRLGTLYDDASVGALLRIGLMHAYFDNLGLLNHADKNKKSNNVQCYLFAKGKLKAIGYNATMQGGLFNKTSIYTIPAKDIERITGILYTGIVISYKRIGLEYTQSLLSPEFKNGLSHGWGHCNITICF